MKKSHYLLITFLLFTITSTFGTTNPNMVKTKTNYVSKKPISSKYKIRTSDREFTCKAKWNGTYFEIEFNAEKKTWFGWWEYATRFYCEITAVKGSFGWSENHDYIHIGLADSGITAQYRVPDYIVGIEATVWSGGVGEKNKGVVRCTK